MGLSGTIAIPITLKTKPMTKSIIVSEDQRPATFGWLQLEKKVGQELQKLAVKHPAAMGTLMYLANNMGRNNALAVSQSVISKKVGVTIASVNRAIKTLDKHRFIEVVKVGNLCVYRVNSRVAWQGNRGEKYAYFSADIIAFEGEQSANLEVLEPLKKVPVLHDGERYLMSNDPIDPPDQQEMELP
jgi:DNA-binding Lrp family transcriptional regulator